MKVTRWLMMAGMATALCMSLNSSQAQDNNQAGGGRGFSRGNFDPARMQEMIMTHTKERLEITDDGEWKALQPLVQKVMELQRQVAGDRMRGMFGRRGGDNNGDQNRRPSIFGAPLPEAEALQKAIDAKASKTEMKAALAKYADARKAKQSELEQAQAELRKVLTLRQEALATMSGLL